ncbi:hypothetical protein Cgig2_014333 [Carnegiea gigantea]|uniref:Uncharacterized protein n=1 Tax=Carnegiea gigantea TaxID=171969 RepID=A0A9Q1JUK3_9CARY|nr:hypothetical protein Cgig2_014333 [Carnegiea gigantea]
MRELYAELMAPPVAVTLSLGRFLSPRRGLGLGLCLRMGLFQLALQVSSIGLQGLFLFLHLLLAAFILGCRVETFGALPGDRRFAPLGSKQRGSILQPLAPDQMPRSAKERISNKIEESRRRLGLTSALATYPSVTFNGSAEPEGARAQDLFRPYTKAYLVERLAAKKSKILA